MAVASCSDDFLSSIWLAGRAWGRIDIIFFTPVLVLLEVHREPVCWFTPEMAASEPGMGQL